MIIRYNEDGLAVPHNPRLCVMLECVECAFFKEGKECEFNPRRNELSGGL